MVQASRRYSADALDRVLLIRFASEMGFTLREIKVFLNGLRDDVQSGRAGKNSRTKRSRKSTKASAARAV